MLIVFGTTNERERERERERETPRDDTRNLFFLQGLREIMPANAVHVQAIDCLQS